MERLTARAFVRARTYLLTHARPLERELFRVSFEGHSPEATLRELGHYRNPDGGFGRALEPDYRAEGSSVLATCMALGRLAELNVPADHPLVEGAIRFLLASYDAVARRWVIVPPEGDDEPHAPWWSAAELEETFSGFRINPLADVLAHLWRYGRDEGRSLARSLLPDLQRGIASAARLEPSEFESLLSLWRSPMDDGGVRAFLTDTLRERLPLHVERDPARWTSYCLQPLWAVPEPHCPGGEALRDTLEAALDWEQEHQQEDGAWDPFWHWDGVFPDHWPTARREWRGWLTLRNLSTLRAYDRLPHGC